MGRDREQERQEAVQRFLGGEAPVTIYRALGRSKPWFFRWLHRLSAILEKSPLGMIEKSPTPSPQEVGRWRT